MTAARRATALAALVCVFAGAARASAQLQPPPFDDQTRPPTRSSAPPPAQPPPPKPAAQARPPQAQPDDPDAIDDPKVSRRLGPRMSVPPPPVRVAPPPARPVPAAPPPTPVQPIPSTTEAASGVPTVERPYTPIAEGAFRPTLPRLKLALRRFDFVQIGASESSDGVAAAETFNSLSIDVYPVSRIVRVGLSTAFGWQSGTWLANGDYFATQSFSLGGQYGGLGRVVPFAEAFAGVGYMRRLQFDRTIPTAYWQFGADAGVEIYAAKVGFLSLALGYLRPVNGFAQRQQFTTVFVDTWSFKVGVGI
jgi:hypothetical protein